MLEAARTGDQHTCSVVFRHQVGSRVQRQYSSSFRGVSAPLTSNSKLHHVVPVLLRQVLPGYVERI